MQSWLTFFGIWIAEGYVKDNVTFPAHKQRVKTSLKRACDLMGFNIKYVSDESGYMWHINDEQLVNFMKALSVSAVNKSLPEWVWNLSSTQAKWLIEGMMLGDGHWMKNGTMRYDTSSKMLADDFQRLCLHA